MVPFIDPFFLLEQLILLLTEQFYRMVVLEEAQIRWLMLSAIELSNSCLNFLEAEAVFFSERSEYDLISAYCGIRRKVRRVREK